MTMRSDLMAGLHDALNQLRVTLGDVAEHEERGPGAGPVEQIEQPIGRVDRRGWAAIGQLSGARAPPTPQM